VIKHRHPAYQDQHQPTQGNPIRNYDPYEEELASEYESEPDYEAIMERRHEKNRPDWA